jgi:hypothetical protein
MTLMPPSEDWFGDLEADDCHSEIERWERADEKLAEQGVSIEDRKALWRSLDPDTPLFDWYYGLRRQGLSDKAAQEYIAYIGRMMA